MCSSKLSYQYSWKLSRNEEQEIRVTSWCDIDSRWVFALASLLFPKHSVCYLNFSFSTFKNKQTPQSPQRTTTKHKDKKTTLCQQFFFPLTVGICYTDLFQKCKIIWTHSYQPHSLLPLVMEEYGTQPHSTLLQLFLQGWSIELVYMIVSICRRQVTFQATFIHILLFFAESLKR